MTIVSKQDSLDLRGNPKGGNSLFLAVTKATGNNRFPQECAEQFTNNNENTFIEIPDRLHPEQTLEFLKIS